MRATDTTPEHEFDADGDSDSNQNSNVDKTDQADDALTDLPPSAKLVYKVLEYEGTMTQNELATESRLCARTVRYALGKLEDGNHVESRVCLQDARQSTYRIIDS
ncbi:MULTISPECIES: MarR family transcriptional regulator [Natrialba]|uniref:ArsR family transcriptional regulator n=1 Tax=Natrialba aegyptia DSM 13077 TaxID=1227491 RepID=M0BC17_9EURY|nr:MULTISPECIES: helix-turn-helix domain-containing protein [Natrialba]ELZ07843.1 hypothetical protein C480_03279 [Natrialba aegyptia DSM 13077]